MNRGRKSKVANSQATKDLLNSQIENTPEKKSDT